MSWVFETLVWKDNDGYIPGLAEKWSYDPEKTAFTFDLNPKAKWHDGEPVTAEDVVFTIEYFKKHPYRWITVDSIDRAEAAGPNRVVITLAEPYSPFLSDIGGTMPVMPKHIWETVDDPERYDDPKAYIGSGPYIFRDFNKAQGAYLYEAFDDYYRGRPKADRLIYVRTGKALMSLMTGQVDLANIRPEMAEPLEKKGLVVIRDERGWNKKLMINHTKAAVRPKSLPPSPRLCNRPAGSHRQGPPRLRISGFLRAFDRGSRNVQPGYAHVCRTTRTRPAS